VDIKLQKGDFILFVTLDCMNYQRIIFWELFDNKFRIFDY